MVLLLTQETLKDLQITPEELSTAVEEFAAALNNHQFTVNVPAPTASPLIEEIVRRHGGEFEVEESEEE